VSGKPVFKVGRAFFYYLNRDLTVWLYSINWRVRDITMPKEKRPSKKAPKRRRQNKIALIREKKGLTQIDMAEIFGRTQAWYSRIERGKINTFAEERVIIARKLGCKVSDLFDKKTKLPKRVTMADRKGKRKKTK